jgi:hypothetical protein
MRRRGDGVTSLLRKTLSVRVDDVAGGDFAVGRVDPREGSVRAGAASGEDRAIEVES